MQGDPVQALLVLAFAALLYTAPGVVALGREHPSVGGVVVLNLFLGWTFVGWVVALAWAFSGPNLRAARKDAEWRFRKEERAAKRMEKQAARQAARAEEARPLRRYPVRVAGLAHANEEGGPVRADYAREHVRIGDAVRLEAEPDNPHDPFAVAIWHDRGWRPFRRAFRLGYVPAERRFVQQCLAEGDRLTAKVTELGPYVGDDGARRYGVGVEITIWADGTG